jgi:hypothetical protein
MCCISFVLVSVLMLKNLRKKRNVHISIRYFVDKLVEKEISNFKRLDSKILEEQKT